MSEAEKKADVEDVEDVLSSIRRLVANGPREVPDPVETVNTAEQTTDELDQTQDSSQSSSPDPVSFIDTMNASIAEMTQDNQDSNIEAAPTEEAETRTAHVDAFLAQTAANAPEIFTQENDTSKKPETLVLRAEMSTEAKTVETAPEVPELVLNEDDDALAEYEAATMDVPEDTVEEISMPDIQNNGEASSAEANTDDLAGAQFVDEDTMREIVSEMVRAELQGDLGDRITRNVRKLVRREIHNALATRDFE